MIQQSNGEAQNNVRHAFACFSFTDSRQASVIIVNEKNLEKFYKWSRAVLCNLF